MAPSYFILTRAEVREFDRRAIEEFAVPGIVLMENAGRGCADLLLRQNVTGPVLICCGKGNNGGDGLVMARHLTLAGIKVQLVVVADPDTLTKDAAVNFAITQHLRIPTQVLAPQMAPAILKMHFLELCRSAGWVVDALLGTGAQGPLSPLYTAVIDGMNESELPIFSVDLPSGLDADTGEPLGTVVRARVTGTLVGLKRGLLAPDAETCAGQIEVVSIGFDPRVAAPD